MNLSETQTLLTYLAGYYPRFEAKPDMWVKHLAHVPLDVAMQAADHHVQRSHFTPKVSDIVEFSRSKPEVASPAKRVTATFADRVLAYRQKASQGLVMARSCKDDGTKVYSYQRIEKCVRIGTMKKKNPANPEEFVNIPIYQTKMDFCVDKLGAKRVTEELRQLRSKDPVTLASDAGWVTDFRRKLEALTEEALGGRRLEPSNENGKGSRTST